MPRLGSRVRVPFPALTRPFGLLKGRVFCSGGATGGRNGLKLRAAQADAGSNPVPSTSNEGATMARGPYTRTRERWADADAVRRAVAQCTSIAAVLAALGITHGGQHYAHFRRIAVELGLDTSHFHANRGWRKGRSGVGLPRTPWYPPLESRLTADTAYGVNSRQTLKSRLVRSGLLKPACSVCGLHDWLGKPIALELDHVNGNQRDSRLENLRLLCPNCHSQTPTFRGRNKRLKRLEREAARNSQVKERARFAYVVTRTATSARNA